MPDQRKLILITGIPGTGKTCYGKLFAEKYGFAHYDLEHLDTVKRLFAAPTEFIDSILKGNGNVVVTWGFVPDERQIGIVEQFKGKGFRLAWFDGNRPASLRAFIERNTVPEELFYLQMWKIENSKVIARIEPLVINTFDEDEHFKDPAAVLGEIMGKWGPNSGSN